MALEWGGRLAVAAISNKWMDGEADEEEEKEDKLTADRMNGMEASQSHFE